MLTQLGVFFNGGLLSFVESVSTDRTPSLGQKTAATARVTVEQAVLHEMQEVFSTDRLDLNRYLGLVLDIHLASSRYGTILAHDAHHGLLFGQRDGLRKCLSPVGPEGEVCGLLLMKHPVYTSAELAQKEGSNRTPLTRRAAEGLLKVGFDEVCTTNPQHAHFIFLPPRKEAGVYNHPSLHCPCALAGSTPGVLWPARISHVGRYLLCTLNLGMPSWQRVVLSTSLLVQRSLS